MKDLTRLKRRLDQAADSTDEANPSPQASITRAERAVQAVRRRKRRQRLIQRAFRHHYTMGR